MKELTPNQIIKAIEYIKEYADLCDRGPMGERYPSEEMKAACEVLDRILQEAKGKVRLTASPRDNPAADVGIAEKEVDDQ